MGHQSSNPGGHTDAQRVAAPSHPAALDAGFTIADDVVTGAGHGGGPHAVSEHGGPGVHGIGGAGLVIPGLSAHALTADNTTSVDTDEGTAGGLEESLSGSAERRAANGGNHPGWHVQAEQAPPYNEGDTANHVTGGNAGQSGHFGPHQPLAANAVEYGLITAVRDTHPGAGVQINDQTPADWNERHAAPGHVPGAQPLGFDRGYLGVGVVAGHDDDGPSTLLNFDTAHHDGDLTHVQHVPHLLDAAHHDLGGSIEHPLVHDVHHAGHHPDIHI